MSANQTTLMTGQEHEGKVLTTKGAAKLLCRSDRWIWSAVRIPENEPGSIPHHRLGRAPRFLRSDLLEWLRANCPPAATFRDWQRKSA